MCYICNNCRHRFDEPEYEETSYESYYSVSSMFPNTNALTLELCPNCGSEDIEEDNWDELPIEVVIPDEITEDIPAEIKTPVAWLVQNYSEEIADWLADEYSYCTAGFSISDINGTLMVTNIEWEEE